MNGTPTMATALNPQLIARLQQRAVQMNPALADRLNGWLAQRQGGGQQPPSGTPDLEGWRGAAHLAFGDKPGIAGHLVRAGWTPNSGAMLPTTGMGGALVKAGQQGIGPMAGFSGTIGALGGGQPTMTAQPGAPMAQMMKPTAPMSKPGGPSPTAGGPAMGYRMGSVGAMNAMSPSPGPSGGPSPLMPRRMRAPDGRVVMVPAHMIEAALAGGGVLV